MKSNRWNGWETRIQLSIVCARHLGALKSPALIVHTQHGAAMNFTLLPGIVNNLTQLACEFFSFLKFVLHNLCFVSKRVGVVIMHSAGIKVVEIRQLLFCVVSNKNTLQLLSQSILLGLNRDTYRNLLWCFG